MERNALVALDITEEQERIYRALLTGGPPTPRDLASAAGLEFERLTDLLLRLEELGLVTRVPGDASYYVPVPPDVALGALVSRRRATLEATTEAIGALVEEFENGAARAHPAQTLQIVEGREQVAGLYEQFKQETKQELLLCDRAPYSAVTVGHPDLELEMLGRGARLRVIYDRSVLDSPGSIELIEEMVRAGEEGRVTDLPSKLAITDARMGLVPLVEGGAIWGCVLVHPSMLLDALLGLFELLWQRATPLDLGGAQLHDGTELTADERRVLSLLNAGMTDEAIARQLRLGVRTVRRRVRSIMERSGARTRFEAGALAAKRRWV